MAKNLMPEIAALLGVEVGEEFKLKGLRSRWIYKFTEDSFLCRLDNFRWESAFYMMEDILHGTVEIEKLPWVPKHGECYYCPSIRQRKVMQPMWAGDTRDYAMKALGMIYRTKAEAEAHLAEDYQRLTGKPLEVENNE